MYKNMIMTALVTMTFIGCGGSGSGTSAKTSAAQPSTGAYTLWDYIVPNQNKTSSYIKTTGDSTEKYQTSFVKKDNRVAETSNYAPNEQTIYTNNGTNITVSFLKDGVPNGHYDLRNKADIGDTVTVKQSDCRLTKHYDSLDIAGITFNDVIEIRCGDVPGYYQRDIGEIAQKKALSTSGTAIRVLSD